ncbi:MAG: hypothetical protein ACKVRN_10080 [Pyrinomonadaceae bacterium]
MKTLFILASIMAVLFLAAPNRIEAQKSAAILTSSTEGATRGAKMASVHVVNAVLDADKDLAVRLRGCMTENHIKKNAANKLFVSVLLPTINKNQQIYFVRGAPNTDCFWALIGAHAFNYWLVSLSNGTYEVRYSGSSDAISILRSIHNGMYDIEEHSFTATDASSARMQFDGSKYVETICKEYHRTKRGKEVVKIVPCSTF